MINVTLETLRISFYQSIVRIFNSLIPVTSLTDLSADTKTCPWVELPQFASGFAQNT